MLKRNYPERNSFRVFLCLDFGVQVQILLPAPSRDYKKDIARGNPDFIGVSTVLYGKILATDFVDVNRSFSLYIRF